MEKKKQTYKVIEEVTMEHSTKPPPSAGYPHPYPPPQYTANPVLLQPAAITQQPGKYSLNASQFHVMTQSVAICFSFKVHVVHIHQNPVVGPHPTMIICYNCHRNVLTRLEYEPSSKTHWLALGLCVFG